jgi:catechol 2,3-dioxygenase-like lactoylglutathione lyase family enzyme
MKSAEIIILPVKDREKAKDFYIKLGFKLIVEAPMPEGGMWVSTWTSQRRTSISLSNFHGLICETDEYRDKK